MKNQIAKGIAEMLMQHVFLFLLAAKNSLRVEQGWIFVSGKKKIRSEMEVAPHYNC